MMAHARFVSGPVIACLLLTLAGHPTQAADATAHAIMKAS